MRKISNSLILLLCTFSISAFAAKKNKTDVMKESTIELPTIDLLKDDDLSLPKANYTNTGSFGASYWQAGHPQISTVNQTSHYDLTNQPGITAEFTRTWTRWSANASIGYFHVEQYNAATATALHIMPTTLSASYNFPQHFKIEPSLNAGVTGLFVVQRGVDESNTSELSGLTNVGASAKLVVPWSVRPVLSYARLSNWNERATQYAGNFWQLAFNFDL